MVAGRCGAMMALTKWSLNVWLKCVQIIFDTNKYKLSGIRLGWQAGFWTEPTEIMVEGIDIFYDGGNVRLLNFEYVWKTLHLSRFLSTRMHSSWIAKSFDNFLRTAQTTQSPFCVTQSDYLSIGSVDFQYTEYEKHKKTAAFPHSTCYEANG